MGGFGGLGGMSGLGMRPSGRKGGLGGMGNRLGGGLGAAMSLEEEEEADAYGGWIPPGQGLRGRDSARRGAARDPATVSVIAAPCPFSMK